VKNAVKKVGNGRKWKNVSAAAPARPSSSGWRICADGATLCQERFAMNIAEFSAPDDTQERLHGDAAPDMERAARADSVRNAIAITMMEGGRPSVFCRELLG
jgi:hypothetical protein